MISAAPLAQNQTVVTQTQSISSTATVAGRRASISSTIASAASPAAVTLDKPKKQSFCGRILWFMCCCGLYRRKKPLAPAVQTPPQPIVAPQPRKKWSLIGAIKWFICCCGCYQKKPQQQVATPAQVVVSQPAPTSIPVSEPAPIAESAPIPEPIDHYANWMRQELTNIEAEVAQMREATPESRERAKDIRRTMRAFVFASVNPSPERRPLCERAQRLIDALTNFIGDANYQHELDVVNVLQDLPNIEREAAALTISNPSHRERARELRWLFRVLVTAVNRQNPQHAQLKERIQRIERQLTEFIGDMDWQNPIDTVGVQQLLGRIEQDILLVPIENALRRQELTAELRLIQRALNAQNPRHTQLIQTAHRLQTGLDPLPASAAT